MDASWWARGDYGVDASLSAMDLRLPRLVRAPGDLLAATTTFTNLEPNENQSNTSNGSYEVALRFISLS